MKNFLTALCALGAAFFTATSFAELTLTGEENFEGYSTGAFTINSDSIVKWASDEASTEASTVGSMGDAAVVTAYEEGAKKPSTTTKGGNNYLKLETSAPLERYVQTGGEALDIGKGLYFDGQVQFTACDEEPTIDLSEKKPEKLIVYLRATEVTGDDGTVTSATTNFVVVAGYYNARGSSTQTNYVCNVPSGYDYDPAAWHRLVVKSYKLGEDNAYFKVLIDSTPLSTASDVKKGDADSKTVDLAADAFPSLDTSSDDVTKLTSIGFKGTGAIDEIAWLNEDPLTVTKAYKFVWDSAYGSPTITVGGVEQKDIKSDTEYSYDETAEVSYTFVAAAGYVANEPTVDTSTGVTIVTFSATEAGAVVTIGDKDTYVKDFVAAVTLVNQQTSDVTLKLLTDATVVSTDSIVNTDDNSIVIGDENGTYTVTLVLNGKSLSIAGLGLFANGGLTIIDVSKDTVTDTGSIITKNSAGTAGTIYSPKMAVYGGKFDACPETDTDSGATVTVAEGYELKESDGWYRLQKTGGSTEPTVDGGDSATTKVDPETKTITVVTSESGELTIEGDASAYTISVPQNVTKITGSVGTITIMGAEVDITSAFSVTTVEGVTTIALDPKGTVTVNGVEISVTPELADATDDVTPFAVVSGSVSATVKAIPGLTYQLLGSTEVKAASAFDTTNPVAEETAGKDGTVTLEDKNATDTAKFYTIRVTR